MKKLFLSLLLVISFLFLSGFTTLAESETIYVAGISFGSVFTTEIYEGIEYKVFRDDIPVSFPSATAGEGNYTQLSNIQTRIDADKSVGFEYPFDILIIPLNLNPNAFLWAPALRGITEDGSIYGLKYIMINMETERYAFAYDVGNGLTFLYDRSVYLDQASIYIPADDISNYVGQYNFDTGYSIGYEKGVEDGYNEGYNKGYNEGYEVGVEYGLSVNDELAYREGYKKGVNDGFMKDISKWFGPMVLIVLIAGAYVTARNRRSGD